MSNETVRQLIAMMAAEEADPEKHGAHLTHWADSDTGINIDAGGLRALYAYYSDTANEAQSYDHVCIALVECFERRLAVFWNGEKVSEEQMQTLLDTRYDQWHDVENNPDAETMCCEEWMLEGVKELGIDYTPVYLDGEGEVDIY